MTRRTSLLLFFLALGLSACAAKKPFPTPLPEGEPYPEGISIYGQEGDGCLLQARAFTPADHPAFVEAYASRQPYAHPALWRLLHNLDFEYRLRFADAAERRIRIGDIARQGGGPLLPHSSHQVGLDTDLSFLTSKTPRPDDFVVTDRGVSGDFDLERNWWLAGYLALQPETDRLFVAPEVKVAFCEQRGTLPDWKGKEEVILQRLRPWFGHRDHFHLHLACPRGEKYCFSKADPPPPGDGCQEARSWFGDPKHVARRLRTAPGAPGVFNRRCWSPAEKPGPAPTASK